jgi:recombination protein RecA
VPRGRIVEVFGPESSGKTTLMYHILAEAQKLGGVCAFIDAEHAMDPLYARRSAWTSTSCSSPSPTTASRRSRSPTCSCAPSAVDVIVIDSVAALTPRAELEGQMGDQTVGLQARMMSQAMRKLAGNLNRTQTLCVFTNQIREKVGVMFGSPETQPGGRALKFYSSQRLDIRRIETLKEGTEAVGNRVRVKVVKNKVAAPFKQAEFDIEFGKGISSSGCILDLGIEHNIVTKSGSFFSYGDERLGQGRNNAKAYLDEHTEVAKEIEGKVYAALDIDPDAVVEIEPDADILPDLPEVPAAA